MTTFSDISLLLLVENLQYMLGTVDLWYKRGKAKIVWASPCNIDTLMDWLKMITFFIFLFISCMEGEKTWDKEPLPLDKSAK